MDTAGIPGMAPTDFELDVTFIEKGSTIAELMNRTSDNCGSTTQSACVGCQTD